MTSSYLFIPGRTPELSLLELRSFFPEATLLSPEVACVTTEDAISPSAIMEKLGGTVKIATILGTTVTLSPDSLVPFLPVTDGAIHFGISLYGVSLPASFLADTKKLLAAKGIRARYATARHGETLSSVTVDKNAITELVVVRHKDKYIVGITRAVQSYEQWNTRDYGRPYADAKAGMLPPKVARMIVNIARSHAFGTLFDPFCGMGTVLSEAYLSGWKIVGSDMSADVVGKAKKNLEWAHATAKMFVSDATHVSETLSPNSIDAIVTEPFMGKAGISHQPSEIRNQIKGLEKLYIGCLRDWSKVLRPGGVAVIALPEYAIGDRIYFVKKVIDMCENLGYTTLAGPIAYSRPQATVRRKFFVFKKIVNN